MGEDSILPIESERQKHALFCSTLFLSRSRQIEQNLFDRFSVLLPFRKKIKFIESN